ncbi:STE like transcription factor-domain-containing protein [Sporodiniella umbellata]|nr:STE like transcription factor-domain-containing protein [Sporodiniella umbellata]
MANASPSQSLLPTDTYYTPTSINTEERMTQIEDLKIFLGTITNNWDSQCKIKAFPLLNGENISCILWNNLYHITGTDIVRTLLHRFHLFGRPVTNLKKFEEGVFSDLRNLKPGMDASLEEPKSDFLEMLYKNNCIRTQKKQKVFYWFSVPHDRLFLDALERDLKREKMGLESTSLGVAEPATSLTLDSAQDIFDQLRKSMSISAVAAAQALDESVMASTTASPQPRHSSTNLTTDELFYPYDVENDWFDWKESPAQNTEGRPHSNSLSLSETPNNGTSLAKTLSSIVSPKPIPFESFNYEQRERIFGAFSLFEGSPTYKQRQRKRTSSLNQHHTQLELAAINAGLAIDPHMFSDDSSTEKAFICPLSSCGRVFKRLEHLKRHFRTHTMERPYACDMCGKSFSRTDNLSQHKKTHTRPRSSSLAIRSKDKSSFSSDSQKPYSDKARRSRTKTTSPSCPRLEMSSTATSSNFTSPAVSPQLFMSEPTDMLALNSVNDDIVLSDYYPTPPSFMWNPNISQCSQDAAHPITSSELPILNDLYHDRPYYQDKERSPYADNIFPNLCTSIYEQPMTAEIYSWYM